MDTAYDEPGHAILFTRSRELVVSCSDEMLEVVYMSSILCKNQTHCSKLFMMWLQGHKRLDYRSRLTGE